MKRLYTAESVTEGHPDKLCDLIADSILDECLKFDPDSRVACEVLATKGMLLAAGEITSTHEPYVFEVMEKVLSDVGDSTDNILMAALNIINSTSMSVAAKTKQYGAMRAVGMDGRQLTKMITAEVLTYAAFGCVIGCAVGLYLNKTIYEAFITAYFGEIWHIPVREIAIILLFIFASVVMAVHAPAKRMRNMEITATINDM